MTITTEARNATLTDLADILTTQRARSEDFVVPASKMRMREGMLTISGVEPILTPDGVTMADGSYRPTSIFDEGVSAKLGVPLAYLRRMRAERPDMYDANVNGWLHGRKPLLRHRAFEHDTEPEVLRAAIPGDDRSFLIRTFKGVDGGEGIARAMLSDSFRLGMDNYDSLVSALEGIHRAGVTDAQVVSADLSERRMVVKIVVPELQVIAPVLLENYRSPWGSSPEAERRWLDHGGYAPGDEPVLFAGLVLSNSDTGNGAFSITPRFVIKKCRNGWVVTKDAMRAVHLGGKLEEGVIDWSSDTQRKQADLIAARTRDAVAAFLNVDYMERVIREAEAKIKPVTDAQRVIESVCKKLTFTEEQAKGILDHFIRGGQMNTAGVANAVTSFAQTVADPDVSFDIEAAGAKALDVAASFV